MHTNSKYCTTANGMKLRDEIGLFHYLYRLSLSYAQGINSTREPGKHTPAEPESAQIRDKSLINPTDVLCLWLKKYLAEDTED